MFSFKNIIISFIGLLATQALFAKSLTVYSSRKEHLIKDIFTLYEKVSGVKINYRTGKSGALIQTIKGEGVNTTADLFMTVDAGNLWHATNSGILQPIKSALLKKNIPAHLRDRNGHWYGLSIRARTIVVNSTLTNDKMIKDLSYEALAKPEWKGKLCLRTSQKVYNQSLVAMLISVHGEQKAQEIVGGWVKNKVDIFSNDTAVLKAVASGQCFAGIVNSYYFGRLIKENPKLPLKLIWPLNQNSYGVHINISGAGVVKGSKNKEAAIKFLEWLASKQAQEQFAQVNMEYPVLASAKNAPIVDSWGNFKPNSTFNLTDAGKLQRRSIILMHEANYK